MKNILIPLLAAASALPAAAQQYGVENSDALIVDSVWVDSVAVDTCEEASIMATETVAKVVSDDKAEATVTLSWPTDGPAELVSSVRHFIADYLLRLTEEQPGISDGKKKRKPRVAPSPNMAGETLAQQAATKLYDNLKEELAYMEGAQLPQFCSDVHIDKVWEYGGMLGYSMQTYEYLGGVHGGYTTEGITFDIETGRPYELIIDPEKAADPALQALLRQGLTQYFSINMEQTIENVDEFLFLPDDGLIPLPATDLWIVPDGVVFIYQSYEIAPYAAGQPSFTIPLEQIRPYLIK